MKSALVSVIVATGVAIVTIGAIVPPKKEFLKPAVIGAVMSFLMCWLMVYFVAPFPKDGLSNAIGNGVSGAMCGFLSSYVTSKGAAKTLNVKKSA